MGECFETRALAVGYNKRIIVGGIELSLEGGSILTLVGANGAGKSTLLKTVANQLAAVEGAVYINSKRADSISCRELARQLAIVSTERIKPELMTCFEVAAMGRYPHTGAFGSLSGEDKRLIISALRRVDAEDIAERRFLSCSDGQRQRVMIARAICQQPRILILDEPTAYLDIRHKIELLDILRELARDEGVTVIMSLHEMDLAIKASDRLLCFENGSVKLISVEQALKSGEMERLCGFEKGGFSPITAGFELKKPVGEPMVFVIGGNGRATGHYRYLQRRGIPFAAGILFENDIDTAAAHALSDHVITAPAFEPMTELHFDAAAALMLKCKAVIAADASCGSLNSLNIRLLELARKNGLSVSKELIL